jgi:hypothetical protein
MHFSRRLPRSVPAVEQYSRVGPLRGQFSAPAALLPTRTIVFLSRLSRHRGAKSYLAPCCGRQDPSDGVDDLNMPTECRAYAAAKIYLRSTAPAQPDARTLRPAPRVAPFCSHSLYALAAISLSLGLAINVSPTMSPLLGFRGRRPCSGQAIGDKTNRGFNTVASSLIAGTPKIF